MKTLAAERMDWADFIEDGFDWRQGEHVTLIGPTGCGKTTLTKQLIPLRSYSLFLGSKRADSTQTELTSTYGFETTASPTGIHPDVSHRWLIRPPFPKGASAEELKATQKKVFRETLMRAYQEGSWAIFIDELRYIAHWLGLQSECVLLYTQGRSGGNSVVAGTQRPRFVPLEAYDQASHFFFWATPDITNVKRVAEFAGINRTEVVRIVTKLKRHEVLYVQPHTGEMVVTKVKE